MLDWFRDEGALQAEIRRGFGARGGSLEILGYDDIAQIGRGGQAIVYRAVQRSTKRPVAIKVVLDGIYAAPSATRRFEREVDLAASLRHPHIVSVYDSGVTADHRPYLVMELVDGPALDEFLASRREPCANNSSCSRPSATLCNTRTSAASFTAT